MSREYDTSVEEVGKTIADLFKGTRLLPDMADVWRAIGERRLRSRMQSHDPDLPEPAPDSDDSLALIIRANSLVVDAGMRMGLDWQRLVERRLPAIRRRLDDYRAEADPLPEVRNALLDEVALFFNELADFASDQGNAVKQDIETLQRDLFPRERIVAGLAEQPPLPHKKVASAAIDAQLALRSEAPKKALDLGKEIRRLDNAFVGWRRRADPHIREMLDHQFDADAKYFRPLTVFSCYRAAYGPAIPDSLITTAQAVEMFHNVSLIIDDLVDKSKTRRGKPSLHARYGELTAYMVAGYIFADGYDLLARQVIDECRDLNPPLHPFARSRSQPDSSGPESSLRSSLHKAYRRAKPQGLPPGEHDPGLDKVGPVRFDIRLLSELVKRLAVAECVQWNVRKKRGGYADWYWLAREDTGSMFEICACLGARDQRFRKFGRALGILYHGCDDVADLFHGRDLGGGGEEDLTEGILTLPAALALETGDQRLLDLFHKGDRNDANVRARLRKAFKLQRENAHRKLDELNAAAKKEAANLGLRYPEGLYLLVDYTRELAPRTLGA
jgi:geranylgeranyl pyrophosphate synthase